MTNQEPIAEVIASDKHGAVLRTVLRVSPPQPPPAAPASFMSLEDPRVGMLSLHRVVERNEAG